MRPRDPETSNQRFGYSLRLDILFWRPRPHLEFWSQGTACSNLRRIGARTSSRRCPYLGCRRSKYRSRSPGSSAALGGWFQHLVRAPHAPESPRASPCIARSGVLCSIACVAVGSRKPLVVAIVCSIARRPAYLVVLGFAPDQRL